MVVNFRSSPKADVGLGTGLLTRWAKSDYMWRSKKGSLFDHLVGDGEHARRNGEAERLGGLEVDH